MNTALSSSLFVLIIIIIISSKSMHTISECAYKNLTFKFKMCIFCLLEKENGFNCFFYLKGRKSLNVWPESENDEQMIVS